jgi:HEPN domain-containing protein
MSVQPDPGRVLRGWVERAEQDLKNAENTLLLQEDCPFETVCFHAQQCAEKYLKALLIHRGVDYPKSHNLEVLVGLIPGGHAGVVDVELADLALLTRFAIEGRYPGDWEPVVRKEARTSLNVARRVRDAARKHLPSEALNP